MRLSGPDWLSKLQGSLDAQDGPSYTRGAEASVKQPPTDEQGALCKVTLVILHGVVSPEALHAAPPRVAARAGREGGVAESGGSVVGGGGGGGRARRWRASTAGRGLRRGNGCTSICRSIRSAPPRYSRLVFQAHRLCVSLYSRRESNKEGGRRRNVSLWLVRCLCTEQFLVSPTKMKGAISRRGIVDAFAGAGDLHCPGATNDR